MTTNSLVSRPAECIVEILQACEDFTQLLALTSTCKRVHSAWHSNASAIIWQVGRQSMPAFEYALLAVRTTSLVKNAVLAGTQPPDLFPIDQWSGHSRQPQLSELKDIIDLQHLVKCIEYMCLHDELWGSGDFEYDVEPILAERRSPVGLRNWKERFFRAIYRVFIAGATLFKSYNEPFSNAGKPAHFLEEHLARVEDDWPDQLPLRDVEYLIKFPTFDLNAEEDRLCPIFDPFAHWIVEDGRGLSTINACQSYHYGDDFDSIEVSAIWELILMIAAYYHTESKFGNGDGKSGFGRDMDFAKQPISGRTRKAIVILFGTFRVEEITMPVQVEDCSHRALVANPISLPKSAEVDIPEILHLLTECGIPNHHNGWPAPPPPLQLFTFILKKHFNLQFCTKAWEHWAEAPFWKFTKSARVFHRGDLSLTDHGFSILSSYEIPELSYR